MRPSRDTAFYLPFYAIMGIAKSIRNAEIPEPHLSKLLRDLCVFFSVDGTREFNKMQFLYVANGGIIDKDRTSKWHGFEPMKYLDEVWKQLKEKNE